MFKQTSFNLRIVISISFIFGGSKARAKIDFGSPIFNFFA
jgi:hypothetical protein